jgi:predicted AlkP superfamily pyrophosphatase or phosphodiesterase
MQALFQIFLLVTFPVHNGLMASMRTTRLSALLLSFAFAHLGMAAPVLMVSVDGMKPEYVLEANRRHLHLPFLRSLLADGSYAEGVVGVWPTITYPSHTTLLTGVAPAEHGILANLQFDPERHFGDAWYWYTPQIRVPTLWHGAHAAGLVTASIGWPVSVDAQDVDYLIPEFWRTGVAEDPSDRLLIGALARPAGMVAQLEAELGPYMMGNDTQLAGDAIKTRYAIAILGSHRPRLMTLHLSSLDEAEHEHGPFSDTANATLEAIDTMLGDLAKAARAADPATVIVVVSDHGFVPLTHKVSLFLPFIAAGLIQIGPYAATQAPAIASWRAQPWLAGGMAAIMLKDPADTVTLGEVGALLHRLQSDPRNGIATVLDRAQIAPLGGFPDASFLVEFKPGFYAVGDLTGTLVKDFDSPHGGHGFSPEFPEMRASFFAAGEGIAKHRDLGVIDMRSIAPTVAAVIGVSMPSAKTAPLHIQP